MSSLPPGLLGERGGFVCDPRFAASTALPASAETTDPVASARAEGFAQGLAQATNEAASREAAREAATAPLELAFARLDADLAEQLRRKLIHTVEALCEATLAPLALDREALARRVERAAAMLARAEDERVLRLHPDDLALLDGRLPQGLATLADPALERGALRIETASGGVEDGPGHWRRAIAEALARC